MTDAGFFKGTSADQDSRFADKKKKLLKSMEFGDNLNKKVDMTKVNVESLRPWIVKRITELLTYEDDILCDYVFNQLSEQHPDPKEIQINMTGFLLSKNARIFISELWDLLLSAMSTPGGVPAVFLEAKKVELSQKQEEEAKMRSSFARNDSEQKRTSNLDSQRTNARTDFPKAESPAAGVTNAGGNQERQSPDRVRHRQKYSSSSAGDRSRSRSISRSPTSRGRRSVVSPLADHDDRSRKRTSRRHAYESSRRSSSGDSRSRRHRRRHHHRGRRSDDEERDYRHRSNRRRRREGEFAERSRRHRRYSDEEESPDDDRRSRRRRERDRRDKQGSDDERPLSPRRPPEGPICVPQDSPPRASPVAVASSLHSASPVTDKPSPAAAAAEEEQEIVALPPPAKRRRSGSLSEQSDEDTKSRHRDDSLSPPLPRQGRSSRRLSDSPSPPPPPHHQGRSSRRPAEDSGREDRAVYTSDRHRRADRERAALAVESSPTASRRQHRSRSRDGIERSRRRDRNELEDVDSLKPTAADYASRYQRMENGGIGERSRRDRNWDEYEHRRHEDDRFREPRRHPQRREIEDFRRSSHSPEGPSPPPHLKARHVSPEGPELPPTLQSVVKPVATGRASAVSHKKSTRRSVSSESDSTSTSSDSSSDASSSGSSTDDSSSGSSTSNSSGAEVASRKRPSESRRLPNRSHRTAQAEEEVDSRRPRPPKTDNSNVAPAKVKQKSEDVLPEGPALPPPSVNDLEWKEHNVSPSSASSESGSSGSNSTGNNDSSTSDSSDSSSSSESDDNGSGRPPKRRHATAADSKKRRDSQRTRNDSYRRRDEKYSNHHQVDRKSSGRRLEEAGRSPRNSSSTEDALRQKALESLLKRKKSTEVH